MAWLRDFLTESAKLWLAVGGVVVLASVVHFVLASGERKDLRQRTQDQRKLDEPEDSTSLRRPAD